MSHFPLVETSLLHFKCPSRAMDSNWTILDGCKICSHWSFPRCCTMNVFRARHHPEISSSMRPLLWMFDSALRMLAIPSGRNIIESPIWSEQSLVTLKQSTYVHFICFCKSAHHNCFLSLQRKQGVNYDCDLIQLFELQSLYYDYYLINLQFVSSGKFH